MSHILRNAVKTGIICSIICFKSKYRNFHLKILVIFLITKSSVSNFRNCFNFKLNVSGNITMIICV